MVPELVTETLTFNVHQDECPHAKDGMDICKSNHIVSSECQRSQLGMLNLA
uniref:Uncharacterized protein n=1 Tax=Arion vulgaris TaxID=1028688 RepID=A0A0B7ARU2_9EUPU